jgi:hypothetical protein
MNSTFLQINLLTPELNPSTQRCLKRFINWSFASWTVYFVNMCVKNQQIHQLFFQFVNYLWYLLHVTALHCHPQGAFLVPSKRCSIEEQSIDYCGWSCCLVAHHWTQHAHPQYSIDCSSILHLSEGTRNSPWWWQCNAETCMRYHT